MSGIINNLNVGTMKKIEAISIYNLLKDAKINKVEKNEDKFAIIGLMKQLRPIATDYEAFAKDAQEKLKGEEHEEIMQKAQAWQGKTASTDNEREEVRKINTYFADYNKRVEDCLKTEAETEVTVTGINEDTFKGLVESNPDWNLGQIEIIGNLMN